MNSDEDDDEQYGDCDLCFLQKNYDHVRELNESERNLISKYYRKIDEIHKEDGKEYSIGESTTEGVLMHMQKTTDEYLEKGIRLNVLYSEITVADFLIDRIIGVLCLYNQSYLIMTDDIDFEGYIKCNNHFNAKQKMKYRR